MILLIHTVILIVHCVSVIYGRGQLLWSDEFITGSSVDTNWVQETGGHGWGNNELQFYTTSNAKIQNSNLIIETRKENYQNMKYTSSV